MNATGLRRFVERKLGKACIHDRGPLHPPGTPFLEKTSHIEQVFRALVEPYNIAFAVGALAGLRTGEVLGLSWGDVDFQNRRVHVRRQVREGRLGPLKYDDPRIVPLHNALAPILAPASPRATLQPPAP